MKGRKKKSSEIKENTFIYSKFYEESILIFCKSIRAYFDDEK